MASKQITINEMIYNTLRTKNTKIPKYYDVLTALGYKLRSDSEWSAFDYWEIETETGDRINISKGYDNRTRLYVTAHHVRGDYKKVDYANLIKMIKARAGNRPIDFIWGMYGPNKRTPRIEKYYRLKERISSNSSLLDLYAKNLSKVKESYEKAKADVDRISLQLIQANNDLLEFKDELRGIYRNGNDD